jgi:hypothetical protein
MENSSNLKNTAIIAYLTIIGSVIAIFMNQEENKSEFASFHIRQALGLFILFFGFMDFRVLCKVRKDCCH